MSEAFKSSKKGYKAVKEGKFWKFYCACGSEMWDNRKKKKSPKSPDLRCMADGKKGHDNCSKGSETKSGNWMPNSVWLSPEEREKLGMDDSSSNDTSYNSNTQKSSNSTRYNDKYKGNVPVSMYAAWAKDMALYLAKATEVTEHDELDKLWRTCLKNTQNTLDWFSNEVAKTSTPVEQQVKDLTDDEEDFGEPADVEEEDGFDDLEEEESEEETKEVDDEYEDLDGDI